jgi:hypothetical protein
LLADAPTTLAAGAAEETAAGGALSVLLQPVSALAKLSAAIPNKRATPDAKDTPLRE